VLVAQEVIHLDTTQTKLNSDLHPVGPKKRFNIDKFQRSFTTMVVREVLPFNLSSRKAVQEAFWAANPEANLPSPSAVHLDVSNMYKEMQPMVRELLHKAEALLSFTQDEWTAPNSLPFKCITVHFVDDKWRLRSLVLGFEPLEGSDTGQYLLGGFPKRAQQARVEPGYGAPVFSSGERKTAR